MSIDDVELFIVVHNWLDKCDSDFRLAVVAGLRCGSRIAAQMRFGTIWSPDLHQRHHPRTGGDLCGSCGVTDRVCLHWGSPGEFEDHHARSAGVGAWQVLGTEEEKFLDNGESLVDSRSTIPQSNTGSPVLLWRGSKVCRGQTHLAAVTLPNVE